MHRGKTTSGVGPIESLVDRDESPVASIESLESSEHQRGTMVICSWARVHSAPAGNYGGVLMDDNSVTNSGEL